MTDQTRITSLATIDDIRTELKAIPPSSMYRQSVSGDPLETGNRLTAELTVSMTVDFRGQSQAYFRMDTTPHDADKYVPPAMWGNVRDIDVDHENLCFFVVRIPNGNWTVQITPYCSPDGDGPPDDRKGWRDERGRSAPVDSLGRGNRIRLRRAYRRNAMHGDRDGDDVRLEMGSASVVEIENPHT